MHSYLIKAIQELCITELLPSFTEITLVNAFVSVILGAIAFNAFDISKIINSIMSKTLFTGGYSKVHQVFKETAHKKIESAQFKMECTLDTDGIEEIVNYMKNQDSFRMLIENIQRIVLVSIENLSDETKELTVRVNQNLQTSQLNFFIKSLICGFGFYFFIKSADVDFFDYLMQNQIIDVNESEIVSKISEIIRSLNLENPLFIDEISELLLKTALNFESKIFGFNISRSNELEYIKSFVKSDVIKIMICIIFFNLKEDELETPENKKNILRGLVEFVCNYYSFIKNTPLKTVLSGFVNQQVENCAL